MAATRRWPRLYSAASRPTGLFLEFDDERSGGFEPLRFVPRKGPIIVLGLVSTKRPELEPRGLLLERIEKAARYLDLRQLAISPQCGFSSTHLGTDLTAEEQAAKLRLVVEVATEVGGGKLRFSDAAGLQKGVDPAPFQARGISVQPASEPSRRREIAPALT